MKQKRLFSDLGTRLYPADNAAAAAASLQVNADMTTTHTYDVFSEYVHCSTRK